MKAPFSQIKSNIFTTLLNNTYINVDKYTQMSVTHSDNLQNYAEFLETAFLITVLALTFSLTYQ